MKINKILWPTDFSKVAEKALPCIQLLSKKTGAEIHVIYVIEDIAHHASWYGDFDQKRIEELMVRSRDIAQKRLDQICEKYLEGCPLYFKHIAVGDPAKEILKRVKTENFDMVVMASHGERGNFRYGSVTEKVLKNSHIPIMIIPVETK